MSDDYLKTQYKRLLDEFVKYCSKNNIQPGTSEFDEVNKERLLVPFVLLCNGDVEKVKKVLREVAEEENIPIDPRFR